ncbi:MAG: glycine cleavage system protein GcvH [Deltaproteobacteria bacterium]|nr:glycine cleavage system protein GcvH [Deltaproteobacteria bacterium]
MNQEGLRISKEHAWVSVEQETLVTIGITQFAQDSMGEITYLELPDVGQEVQAGEFLCAIGSSKAFVDLLSPLSGEVVEVNEKLTDTPNLVNQSPYDDGWFIKLKASNLEEIDDLMDNESYEKFIEEETM